MPLKPKSPSRVSWSTREFILSITTSAPAERTIVLEVEVWRNDTNEIEHHAKRLPVVSLESSLIHRWSRRDPAGERDNRGYAAERELQDADAGYQFECEEIRRDVVVLSPDSDDGELTTLAELREHQPVDVVYRLILVICDWPTSEDETRLAPIVADAVSDATKRITQQPASERIAS